MARGETPMFGCGLPDDRSEQYTSIMQTAHATRHEPFAYISALSAVQNFNSVDKNTCKWRSVMLEQYSDVLDVGEIASILHVSKGLVYNLIHSNQIRGFLVGRKYRVLKTELIRFLSENQIT